MRIRRDPHDAETADRMFRSTVTPWLWIGFQGSPAGIPAFGA